MDPQQQMCISSLHSLYEAYDDIDELKYNYKLTKQEILDMSRKQIQKVIKTTYASTQMDTSITDFKRHDFDLMKTISGTFAR